MVHTRIAGDPADRVRHRARLNPPGRERQFTCMRLAVRFCDQCERLLSKYGGRLRQHGCLEPQPLEVADAACTAVVFVRGATVEHVVVVDELHVAGQQVHQHVVLGIVGHAHDRLQRLPLHVAESGASA